MAAAVQPLARPQARKPLVQAAGPLGLAPVLAAAVLAVPVLAGLVGTALPAFGYLPALGGHTLGLDPWRELVTTPGFATSLALTLWTALASTLLSLVLAVGVAAATHGTTAARRLGAGLAPLLAVPHAALAIGLAFVMLPSGWLVRLVSPGLTGWELPPDVLTVGHPSGWPIIASLVIKELPYLLLMMLAALSQVRGAQQVAAARSMGYGRAAAWVKVVLPQVYAQIRLPVLAVLAFSLTVVDVALVLGPGSPPTLAVLAIRGFADPDVSRVFPAAAAAMLLLALSAAAIFAWRAAEALAVRLGTRWIERGSRAAGADRWARVATALALALAVLAGAALLGLLLWSFAAAWRYPAAWPTDWTLAHWQRQSVALARPLADTLVVACASTALGLALTLAVLEHGSRSPSRARAASGTWQLLVYAPLIVPQIAFLFGAQVLLVRLGLDGTLAAVVWAHTLFVMPYVYLSLTDPWHALDPRYARTAASLGAGRARVFWRIKLPILFKPLLTAAAVGFAVSIGLYLPTLFAGAGRVATLTTEAVTLAAGADRRVIGTWAVLQAGLPLAAFLLAWALPRLQSAGRRGLA
jgi:putative thiamine transport system permease protein